MTVTSPPGQVLRDEDGMRLEFVRTFDEPVETVWAALTEPDRIARWFGTLAGDPAGGTVELVMTEEEGGPPQTVTIAECAPPARLVVELPSPDGTWRLSTALSGADGATTLLFVQRLAEPCDASSIGPGWQYYLDRLRAVVTGSAVPGAWSTTRGWEACTRCRPDPRSAEATSRTVRSHTAASCIATSTAAPRSASRRSWAMTASPLSSSSSDGPRARRAASAPVCVRTTTPTTTAPSSTTRTRSTSRRCASGA